MDWWLENVNPSKSPNNAAHYRWALTQLSETIRGKRLKDLTAADVEAELKRLVARKPGTKGKNGARAVGPLGKTSLVKIRRTVATVLTEAERRGMLVRNVAKLAHLPVNAKPPKCTTCPDRGRRHCPSGCG